MEARLRRAVSWALAALGRHAHLRGEALRNQQRIAAVHRRLVAVKRLVGAAQWAVSRRPAGARHGFRRMLVCKRLVRFLIS